jgi:flagellar basal-body rod protein FlgG
MLRGLYTATAGMIAQQRRHDTLTNNISNMNTPGYKADNAMLRSFPEFLMQRIRDSRAGEVAPRVGRISQGVMAEEKIQNFAQGDLRETSNPYDFALVNDLQVEGAVFDASGKFVNEDGEVTYQPQAFFTVIDESGNRFYTRNGRFVLNAAGELVTPQGYRVLGANEEPIVYEGRTQVKVDKKNIIYDAFTGERIDDVQPFLISRVENPNRLTRRGDGVFSLEEDAEVRSVLAGEEIEIHQNNLERANIDPAQTMVDMMTAMRAYEANQKVIQFYDRSLDKAVNEVGRIY